MVDEDVARAVVFEVGDLQAVGVSDLLRLEGGVDGVHFDHCFGLLSLRKEGGRRRGKRRCFSVLEMQGSTRRLVIQEQRANVYLLYETV